MRLQMMVEKVLRALLLDVPGIEKSAKLGALQRKGLAIESNANLMAKDEVNKMSAGAESTFGYVEPLALVNHARPQVIEVTS